MRRKEPETISFPNSKAIKATRTDVLVEVDGKQRWVPQRWIHDDSEIWRAGDEGVLVVEEWWVEENGWLDEE
jgi:hypothetical protein